MSFKFGPQHALVNRVGRPPPFRMVASLPTPCPICGASPRTHACDEEACEPTTPEDPPPVRELGDE